MILLKRLPHRRLELLFSLLMVSFFFGLALLLKVKFYDPLGNIMVLVTLELILPLSIGLVTAGLMAGDPVLDIVLSAHRPPSRVLLERLLVIGGVGVFLGTSGLLLAPQWGITFPKEGSDQMFIWLSPMVFCMGLSSAAAMLRGRMVAGVAATVAVMGVALMTLMQIPQVCSMQGQSWACVWWLFNPLMTLGSSYDNYWPLNRLVWLGLGAGLLVYSLNRAQHEEQLIHAVLSE